MLFNLIRVKRWTAIDFALSGHMNDYGAYIIASVTTSVGVWIVYNDTERVISHTASSPIVLSWGGENGNFGPADHCDRPSVSAKNIAE